MKSIKMILLPLNLLLFGYYAFSQNLTENNNIPKTGMLIEKLKLLDEVADSILIRTKIPGLSLAVSFQERLVYNRGHGYSQLNSQDTIALSENSIFRIASISKPITALAIMHLIEKGKLGLDNKIYNILKMDLDGVKINDERIYEIEIRDLLSHTGGWDRNASGDPAFNVLRMSIAMGYEPPGNELAVIKYMLSLPLDFEQGSNQIYSNFGYMILGRIIENITGRDYEEFIRNEILKPNKISKMRIGNILLKERNENEVFYHDSRMFPSIIKGGGIKQAPYGAFNLKAMKAHGGWTSSASELLRFLTVVNEMQHRKDILFPKTIQKMKTPYTNSKIKDTKYGMGWEIMTINGKPIWFHSGDLPGTTAFLVHAGDVEFAVLLNGNAESRENSEYILSTLVNAVIAISDWPEIDLFE